MTSSDIFGLEDFGLHCRAHGEWDRYRRTHLTCIIFVTYNNVGYYTSKVIMQYDTTNYNYAQILVNQSTIFLPKDGLLFYNIYIYIILLEFDMCHLNFHLFFFFWDKICTSILNRIYKSKKYWVWSDKGINCRRIKRKKNWGGKNAWEFS